MYIHNWALFPLWYPPSASLPSWFTSFASLLGWCNSLSSHGRWFSSLGWLIQFWFLLDPIIPLLWLSDWPTQPFVLLCRLIFLSYFFSLGPVWLADFSNSEEEREIIDGFNRCFTASSIFRLLETIPRAEVTPCVAAHALRSVVVPHPLLFSIFDQLELYRYSFLLLLILFILGT